jgi:hypothetical protein
MRTRRHNPEFPENDPSLTVEKMRLRRVAAGAYDYDNAATGTTWRLVRREVPGKPEWMWVHKYKSNEGGNDVFYSLAETKDALAEYLRGRYFDRRYGWWTYR